MANIENLNQLFKVTGKCPVNGCDRMLIPMEMLAHLLMHHSTEEAAMHEVFAGDVSIYGIDLKQMQPGQNHCIAKISFVHRSDHDKEPNQRQICKQMPIMLMLYVTNWASLIASKFVEDHIIPSKSHHSDNMKIYLIYLISCSTTRKAGADVLALDANRKRICYGTRVIRNYADSPLVATQLEPFGCDFLYFTAADVAYLNDNGNVTTSPIPNSPNGNENNHGPGAGQQQQQTNNESLLERKWETETETATANATEQTELKMKEKQLLLRLVMRGEPDLF